ncbi:MAG: radical SAM protein [Candidatus Bathyarchaeota archaeon]
MNNADIKTILSLEQVPGELTEVTSGLRERRFGKELRFYYPKPGFQNISITGTSCALMCKHCSGHYLEGMRGAETPSELRDLCVRHEGEGGVGVLVSGGSDPHGRVPLERFYETLTWVKENTGLIVNVHTGLLGSREAEEIASTGVDIVSVDVVGSDETIRRVYGMDAMVEDYVETLRALKEADVPHIVPHICVGLDFGEIRGEARALEIMGEIEPEIIVILGLIPTRGTPMGSVTPPSSEDLAKVVAATRVTYPDSSVAVGCMRPRADKGKGEMFAIKAGADRLVLPTISTVRTATAEGFDIIQLDGCCAIPESLEHLALRG